VGGHLFGGAAVNGLLAALIVVSTITHGTATITSVLGRRLHVGIATLISGAIQVAAAVVLARRFGVIGVPIAALAAQLCVLIPSLMPAFAERTSLGAARFARDVIRPWLLPSLPAIAICLLAGPMLMPI